jgi:hypothetical protein
MCSVLYGSLSFFLSLYFVSWNAQRSASWIHYTSIGLDAFFFFFFLFLFKNNLSVWLSNPLERVEKRDGGPFWHVTARNSSTFKKKNIHCPCNPPPPPSPSPPPPKRNSYIFFVLFCFTPHFYSKKKGKILRSSTISVDFFRHKEKYHKYKREKGQQQTNNTHKKWLNNPENIKELKKKTASRALIYLVAQ